MRIVERRRLEAKTIAIALGWPEAIAAVSGAIATVKSPLFYECDRPSATDTACKAEVSKSIYFSWTG